MNDTLEFAMNHHEAIRMWSYYLDQSVNESSKEMSNRLIFTWLCGDLLSMQNVM